MRQAVGSNVTGDADDSEPLDVEGVCHYRRYDGWKRLEIVSPLMETTRRFERVAVQRLVPGAGTRS